MTIYGIVMNCQSDELWNRDASDASMIMRLRWHWKNGLNRLWSIKLMESMNHNICIILYNDKYNNLMSSDYDYVIQWVVMIFQKAA